MGGRKKVDHITVGCDPSELTKMTSYVERCLESRCCPALVKISEENPTELIVTHKNSGKIIGKYPIEANLGPLDEPQTDSSEILTLYSVCSYNIPIKKIIKDMREKK